MILQVALDFVDIERAVKVAREIADLVDWIEAGTPLIKAHGMDAIRRLKKEFPEKRIVADLKIADTGDVETEIASKAGADIVTVLATADEQTLIHAIEAAKNYGCEIMVDLLNADDPASKAKRAEELGANYVMVHTGIDQQMIGKDVFEGLLKIKDDVKIPIAVGGGLTPETSKRANALGAEIIIVGGAITKAPDSRKVAESFRSTKSRNLRSTKRQDDPIIENIIETVSTSNISDAMHHQGEMRGLMPVTSNRRFHGKAITVRAYPGDWSKTVQSIDAAEEGDVIVIDAHGSRVALWGELASRSAMSKKIAGLIIDGGVRDIHEIREMGFPVFARCISPAAGEPKGMGEINVPIRCAGVEVSPGDYVVADDNGIVVIPKARRTEILKRARYVKEKEDRVKKEIGDGKTLGQILELGKWDKI